MGRFLDRDYKMTDFRVFNCYSLTNEQIERVEEKINFMINTYEENRNTILDNATINCYIEVDSSGWYVRLQDIYSYSTINMVERMGNSSELQ